YLPSGRDPRIRAVVADAPDPLPLAPNGPRLPSQVPLLLIHGDRDAIAPFAGSQQVTRQLMTPGWFLVLHGADHLSPIVGPSPWTATFDRVTGDFLDNVFARLPNSGSNLVADVNQSPASITALS
ncbi:MAG: hypothetical protein M3083_01615, partial [Actinomycetota bacterium]|nr:hypothetical protein [Actinomycetota bacterium]